MGSKKRRPKSYFFWKFRERLRTNLDKRIDDAVIENILQESRKNEIERLVRAKEYKRETRNGDVIYKRTVWEVKPAAMLEQTPRKRLHRVSRLYKESDIEFDFPDYEEFSKIVSNLNESCDVLSRLRDDDPEMLQIEIQRRVRSCIQELHKTLAEQAFPGTVEDSRLLGDCFYYSALLVLLRDFSKITVEDRSRSKGIGVSGEPSPEKTHTTWQVAVEESRSKGRGVSDEPLPDKAYTNRQVAIAYRLMGVPITSSLTEELMKRHTANTVIRKLLEINPPGAEVLSQLPTNPEGRVDKRSAKARKADLEGVLRLITSGDPLANPEQIQTGINAISAILKAYLARYNKEFM